MRLVLTLAVAALAFAAWRDAPPAAADPIAEQYSTEAILPASYLGSSGANLIQFAMIPGRSNEAVVAEQNGHIWRVALDGSFAPALWGDVTSKIHYGGEEGLLSLAFSPTFLSDSRIYLYYTPGAPADMILARYSATDTDLNEASEEEILQIPPSATFRMGGQINFDSDGLLYLSVGDGSGGGALNNAQNLEILQGKILRIDVSGVTGYTIPPDNPFDDGSGPIKEEIFAYGFRNPFRTSIDPLTDDLWVGDVGQNLYEEVDGPVVKGANYGWDCYEGNHVYDPTDCSANVNDYVFPRAEYDHNEGLSVIGGYIYRGTMMPELYGWYVYADFYYSHVWALNPADTSPPVLLATPPFPISSFTSLLDGELAIVGYDDGIHRLTPLDEDGDGLEAASDNCPAWPNPSQTLPPWPLPNDDPDCDGWSWNAERFMTTEPTQRCMATSMRNDEPPPDRWPVDFDDNRAVNGSDLLMFAPVFYAVAPNAPYGTRFDLNNDGRINGSDLLKFAPFFYKNCE